MPTKNVYEFHLWARQPRSKRRLKTRHFDKAFLTQRAFSFVPYSFLAGYNLERKRGLAIFGACPGTAPVCSDIAG
jgi:hypothetical protein